MSQCNEKLIAIILHSDKNDLDHPGAGTENFDIVMMQESINESACDPVDPHISHAHYTPEDYHCDKTCH
jgi:hypothetical protein